MTQENTPIDPLPEQLPDVDLPEVVSFGFRKEGINFRGARLSWVGASSYYYYSEGHTWDYRRVPWNLVRAALASEQPARSTLRHEPEEVKAWEPKVGGRAYHEHGGWCTIVRANPEGPSRGLKSAWLVEFDSILGKEIPALGQFMTEHAPAQDAPARADSPQRTCPGEGGYACNCNMCKEAARGAQKASTQPVEPGSTDPYKGHDVVREAVLAAAQLDIDARGLAALTPRERRIRQALADLDRPLPRSTHPPVWPEDSWWDTDEMGVS